MAAQHNNVGRKHSEKTCKLDKMMMYHHSSSSGPAERVVQTIKSMSGKLEKNKKCLFETQLSC